MGVRRSSFYSPTDGNATIVLEIRAITNPFVTDGYRRVGAKLRQRGRIVNGKKVRWLMKEHGLNP